MKNLLGKSVVLLAFSGCIGLFQFSKLASFSQEVAASTRETALIEVDKRRDTIRLSSQLPRLGFDNIRANLTFLSFLQYFGNDEARDQSGYNLSASFFESIITDDPYYRDFYVFMTNSVSIRAAQPNKSVELIETGLASFTTEKPSDSFYIWRYKAVEELLFLSDSEAAKHSFRKAAEWAKESALPESELIASISQQTADFLEQNPDSRAAQIGAWSSVLTTAVDDETRGRAIQGIQALGGEVVIDENGGVTVKYAQGEQNTEG